MPLELVAAAEQRHFGWRAVTRPANAPSGERSGARVSAPAAAAAVATRYTVFTTRLWPAGALMSARGRYDQHQISAGGRC